MDTELQAPAVAQRLGGTARDLIRELPPAELRDGRINALTGDRETGLEILLRGLARRHGQYAVEVSTSCIIELLSFRRRSSESIDKAMSQCETQRNRVRQSAPGFDLPVPVATWLLVEAVNVPRQMWPLVLAPLQPDFPGDRGRSRSGP